VTLTLESVSATTAIIKWSAAHDRISASSAHLLVRRLDTQLDVDSLGGVEDDGVHVAAYQATETDGHYHLDQLTDGQTYSAQLVVDDRPPTPPANLSNVLYFTTPEGLSAHHGERKCAENYNK